MLQNDLISADFAPINDNERLYIAVNVVCFIKVKALAVLCLILKSD